jgi:hypothetical protein
MVKKSKSFKKTNRLSIKKTGGGGKSNKIIVETDPVCPSDYPQCCRVWTNTARCIPRLRTCKKSFQEYKLDSSDKPYSKNTITRQVGVAHGDACPLGN